MKSKGKRGSRLNRGYVGYHTTWNGNVIFLRSKCEFTYAKYLDIQQKFYLVECVTYEMPNGHRYKPDFFIYDSERYDNLVAIVETKGLDDKSTALKYIKEYKQYFDQMGIEYDAIWKYQSIITKYNLQPHIDKWVENSISKYDFVSDVRGENNPMYGLHHTEETKRKISKKAKQRLQDETYKENLKFKIKEFYNSDKGKKLKSKLSNLMKQRHKRKIEEFENNHPMKEYKCVECNCNISSRVEVEFCSTKCEVNWKRNNIEGYGKHKKGNTYANNLKTYIKRIIEHYNIEYNTFLEKIDEYVKMSKRDEIIPNNKGITLKTINKYKLNEDLKWLN